MSQFGNESMGRIRTKRGIYLQHTGTRDAVEEIERKREKKRKKKGRLGARAREALKLGKRGGGGGDKDNCNIFHRRR